MNITRSFLALALAFAPAAVGCSHDEAHDDDSHAARTSGDEHTHAPAGSRDTDHDAVAADDQATAFDQSESPADLEITRHIRADVVGDSSLSFGARNCVIITRDGEVLLRGDVTRAESDAIERHAINVAGAAHVRNALHTTDHAD
jgi:osmotically-inducible protein OsmY